MDVLAAVRDSIYFGKPEYFLFLPFVAVSCVVALLVCVFKLRSRPAKTDGSSYPLIGKIKLWFFALGAAVAMVVAAARPFLVPGGASFKRGSVEVPIALDISASMWVKDVKPSRLEVTIREIVDLFAQDILREGDRAALFVFGTTAVRKVHLSSDAERFVDEVGRIGPPLALTGDAFPWETDVATAFEHVYQSLDNQDRFMSGDADWRPVTRSDRLVLMFADGDYVADGEQGQRLDLALAEFRRRGLKIYPIGIGTRSGADLSEILVDYEKGADYDETLEAELVGLRTRLNTDNLSPLQQRTGGRTFIIDNDETQASGFLRDVINSHRSLSFELIPDDERHDIWQFAIGVAILMFALAIAFY